MGIQKSLGTKNSRLCFSQGRKPNSRTEYVERKKKRKRYLKKIMSTTRMKLPSPSSSKKISGKHHDNSRTYFFFLFHSLEKNLKQKVTCLFIHVYPFIEGERSRRKKKEACDNVTTLTHSHCNTSHMFKCN